MIKIIYIFILTLIFSSATFSQNDDEQEIIKKMSEPFTKNFINIISNKNQKLSDLISIISNPDSIKYIQHPPIKFSFTKYLDRILECGLRQQAFYYLNSILFELNVLSNNDTIISIKFYSEDLGTLYSHLDTLCFQPFKNQHEKFYNSNISYYDSAYLPFELFTFGYACGIVGLPTYYGNEMAILVKKRDYKTLKKWLLSMNLELQSYGVLGLVFLKHRGYMISKADENYIEHVRKQKVLLNICEGCFNFQTSSIIEQLSDENINEGFKIFTEYNWFGDYK